MRILEKGRLKFLIAFGTAMVLTIMPGMSTPAEIEQPSLMDSSHKAVPGGEVLEINLVGSLKDVPTSVELAPGELSGPIQLKRKGVYRVEAVPYKRDPRWGQSYTFHLMDARGRELDRMIIGSHSSATFLKYGVQAELLALHQRAVFVEKRES